MPVHTLQIRHVAATAPHQFRVVRAQDLKDTEPTPVASPYKVTVEGRPNSHLMRELRWYLEDFLAYPFHPETDHAEQILAALQQWGSEAFKTLFDRQQAGAFYETAVANGAQHLLLQIASDDPTVLGWPWEALHDAQRGFLAHHCQIERRLSRQADPPALDPFASVAGAMLKAGVRSVTAMRYSLYVSAAQQFLPAFYRRLFETGQFAAAARAGRQQLLSRPQRVCARGTFPLQDWMVPVLYEQDRLQLQFATESSAPDEAAATQEASQQQLPPAALPYGFIGRDGALLKLERALHRPPPVLLVNGLGGIGKTTLAHGFAEWLLQTDGFSNTAGAQTGSVFWFDFREIRSAEYVLNRIGEAFLGPNFALADTPQKLDVLCQALPAHRSLIVWDNFEQVYGIAGTGQEPTLGDDDRQTLHQFIQRLSGGKTKVLITSRSPESWLARHERFVLTIGGLQGEERWAYCNAVLQTQGRMADREDADIDRLLQLLGGHPLAMRVILPELESKTPAQLIQELEQDIGGLEPTADDPADERTLFGTLRHALAQLPEDLQPLLVPLALHEQVVDGDYLQAMAQQIDESWSRESTDNFLRALCGLGLLADLGQAIHELHPLVTRFLRADTRYAPTSDDNRWARAFTEIMAALANQAAPQPLHEQRSVFFMHELNFRTALAQATRLAMDTQLAALLQSLGAYALNTRKFTEAEQLFRQLADHLHRLKRTEHEAAAYHQLGIIAQERRDYDSAEKWYLKSLEIEERIGNESGAAITYHQLGIIAQERRDYDSAEKWYLKSLEINERIEKEAGAAISYHQLGIIAQERRDYDSAEKWYLKSLEINERIGHESGAASTYHQLGRIAEERRDYDSAEKWYLKSLEIKERIGNESGAAITYHQLGIIAQERRDYDSAEKWYLKSLEIKERIGNSHGAALSHAQLGLLDEQRGATKASASRFIQAAQVFHRGDAAHLVAQTRRAFLRVISDADEATVAQLQELWTDAGLPDLDAEGNRGD